MRNLLLSMLLATAVGCSAFPDVVQQPRYHNPFPQLYRIAVLPFFNQSAEPTVDQDAVALAYYNELQAIPGFEVMPVGVAKQLALAHGLDPSPGTDFQELARALGVDAIVVGSVTEFSSYYPPRLGLSVRWYAANPGFHPIPPGYGLPWGTTEEEFIPDSLVFEAELALAKQQLQTQTPAMAEPDVQSSQAQSAPLPGELPAPGAETDFPPEPTDPAMLGQADQPFVSNAGELPLAWPDPRGFIPPPPSPRPPAPRPQGEPVMTHTRIYHGNDGEFTERLANYFYLRDDARFGDWQGYLQRSDDFIRFCCHLHITEMLAARGGAGKTRVVWRWPIGRYER